MLAQRFVCSVVRGDFVLDEEGASKVQACCASEAADSDDSDDTALGNGRQLLCYFVLVCVHFVT